MAQTYHHYFINYFICFPVNSLLLVKKFISFNKKFHFHYQFVHQFSSKNFNKSLKIIFNFYFRVDLVAN